MMDDYERSYKQLVASVGASLKKADLETLDYFYREPLSRARGRADEAWTGLGLLRTLEEAGVFSARRPEGLAGVMSEVPREDQRAIVEKFICDNRSTKSRQLPGGKREAWLPGHSDTATAIPDLEKDSPYFAAAVQNPSTSGDDSDNYTIFIPPSRSMPWLDSVPGPSLSPQSSISSSSSGHTGSSTEDEDRVEYSYVRSGDWLTTDHAPQFNLSQTMRLLTNPLRTMVRRRENHTLTSKPIRVPLHPLLFKLHIDPLGPHGGVAVTLYLWKQFKTDFFMMAELTLTHPSRQSRKRAKSDAQQKRDTSPPLVLFQTSVVMDMSDEATPTGPSVVARFPMVLSHKNLTNRKLVKAPFLNLSLSVRQLSV